MMEITNFSPNPLSAAFSLPFNTVIYASDNQLDEVREPPFRGRLALEPYTNKSYSFFLFSGF
jgi:hypothetical protein